MSEILFAYAASNPRVGNARIGAVITTRKKRIVSFGHNKLKTSPFQARFGKNADSIYLHAETAAIRNALRILSNPETLEACYLWVLRVKHESPKGPLKVALAKPCIGCQRAIAEFNLKRTYFTTENGEFEEL